MTNPHNYPQFPGFPAQSSAHAAPLRHQLPGALKPAISQAQHESRGRSMFGPPPGGWPEMPALVPTIPAGELTPVKQRVLDGVSRLSTLAATVPMLGLAAGAILAALPPMISGVDDATLINGINWWISEMRAWVDESAENPPPFTDDSATSVGAGSIAGDDERG